MQCQFYSHPSDEQRLLPDLDTSGVPGSHSRLGIQQIIVVWRARGMYLSKEGPRWGWYIAKDGMTSQLQARCRGMRWYPRDLWEIRPKMLVDEGPVRRDSRDNH